MYQLTTDENKETDTHWQAEKISFILAPVAKTGDLIFPFSPSLLGRPSQRGTAVAVTNADAVAADIAVAAIAAAAVFLLTYQ